MLLPAETTQLDLLRRSARLMVQFRDQIGKRPMVLPNADFFPDRFTGDRASTQQLLERMQEHAGLVDIPVDVALAATDMDDLAAAHACAGSCAAPNTAAPNQRIIPHSDGWIVQLSPGELHHAVALTCTLARSLGSIFLVESAPRPEVIEAPIETSVDLAATALGFGALLLEGSHIYSKSCGGPSIAQVTSLMSASKLWFLRYFRMCTVTSRNARCPSSARLSVQPWGTRSIGARSNEACSIG